MLPDPAHNVAKQAEKDGQRRAEENGELEPPDVNLLTTTHRWKIYSTHGKLQPASIEVLTLLNGKSMFFILAGTFLNTHTHTHLLTCSTDSLLNCKEHQITGHYEIIE